MNRIFRIVWNRAIGQLVVASELANSARGGATPRVRRVTPLRAALYAGLILAGLTSFDAYADTASPAIQNVSFETGTLSGWSAGPSGSQSDTGYKSAGVGASVVSGMTAFTAQDTGGHPNTHSWTVTPYGQFMASLQAGTTQDSGDSDPTQSFATGSNDLKLSQTSQADIGTFMGSAQQGAPTNASWIYQDIVLNAGDSFSMAWQYISTDYTPFNDFSVTSLVNVGDSSVLAMINNELKQYSVLGATNPGTGNYSTDSYGATGWQVATYSVATAGTYRLGFMSVNLSDTINSPILFVDQAPGNTFDHNTPFGPVAPNPGSTAPPAPSGPTTIDSPTGTNDLGNSDGKFDGGTLTSDQSGDVDNNFTVTDKGGVIDQAGKETNFTGTIGDDSQGVPGNVTIINSGNGGDVTFSGTNTYTGTTSIGEGSTLSLSGNGTIASSSGVANEGTFDIADANNDVDVKAINGSGKIDLGGNDLVITDAHGPGATGTISGAGGIEVTGGTQVLGGDNTYTGGTTVKDATVQVGNDKNLGATSGGLVLDNGTLHTTGDVDTTRNITVVGQGTVNTDANTTTASTGTVSGSGALIKNGEGTADFEGVLSHTGGTVVNDGTLVLGGANTYTGGTVVNGGGTLQIDNDANLGNAASDLALNGGTLHTTSDVDTARDLVISGPASIDTDANTTTTSTGTVSGSGALIKNGEGKADFEGVLSHTGGTVVNDGTLVLGGANTYTGGTVVNGGGTLQIDNDANLGNALGTVVINGGSLHTTGDVDMARNLIVIGSASIDTDANTTTKSSGPLAGPGMLIKNGEGTADFEGVLSHTGGTVVNDGTLVLGGANTYTGGTVVNGGGTLQISNDANLGNAAGNLALNGGTLHTTGDVDTARDLSIVGPASIDTDANTTTTSTGAVSGNGTLIKNGEGKADFEGVLSHTGGTVVNDGTLVLGGANTYTGGTVVNGGGTLQISNDANLGNAAGNLALNGGTLHTTGDVDTARDLSITGPASITTDANTTTTSTGAVSGNGTLIKNGEGKADFEGVLSHTGGTVVNDGTLVLGGANTYTGGTVVNGGGTLQISNDANLGNAAGNLVINGGTLHTTGNVSTVRNLAITGPATITTDASTTTTSTGAVSGSGTLIKNGGGKADFEGVLSHNGGTVVNDGTLVLGGANTYTGGTVVNHGGTLQIASDKNLGAASNTLALAGGTLHTTGNVGTSRALVLAGAGALNTDAGTTLLSKGTVSGTGMLVKNGNGTAEFDAVLSHTGGTVVNEGVLILGGKNTYKGGTTVNGGVLAISSDANLGDAGNVLALNGGTVATTADMTTQRTINLAGAGGSIDTASGTTFSQRGSITGGGTLTKQGGGTLVVSGINTFTGGTFIDGGVVRIDNGSSLGTGNIILRGGFLETYATLQTGQQVLVGGQSGVNVLTGTSTVLAGNIVTDKTAGCFVKSGGGSLALTGHAMLGNGTCVDEGTLRANGVLDSAFVNVAKGATLRGVGVVTGPVDVSGRLAPGNSPGTLVVNGTVTMNDGSTFEADIDGLGTGTGRGSYSRLLVVGAGHQFIANGTLEPLLRGITGDASNAYTPSLGDSYRIVSAEGGIVGRFDTLSQPSTGLSPRTRFVALYNVNGSNSIDLRVVPTAYADLLGADARGNTVAVAGALDRAVDAQVAGTADSVAAAIGTIGSLTTAQLPGAVKAMAGEVHADQAAAARGMGLALSRDAVDHLGTDGVGAANRVWANVTQDGQRAVADRQASGFNTSTSHITAGVDVFASDETVVGVGASHGESNIIASGGNGTIRSNAGLVYGQQKLGGIVFDGVVAHGSDNWSSRRTDPLGGGSLESRADGRDTTASLTARLPIDTAAARIEPYLGVTWQKVERDALQETGRSAAALSVDKLSQTGTRGVLGVTAGSHANDPLANELTWRVGLAAGVDSGKLLDPTVRAQVLGQSFETRAPDAGRGFVQVNASGTMRLGSNTYLYGGLNAEQGSGRSAYGVTAGVRVAF